jgi:hypothetical protein
MKKSLLFFCLFSLFVQGIFSQELNWRNLILDSETNFYQVQESFQNEWRNIERPYPKGKGFMAYKRWEWYMEPRVFPTGKRIPTNAIQLAKQENPAMFPPPSGTSGLWTYIGNSSVPGGGGGAGRVNAIRPQPGSSTIFYACAPAGGLWKTTDAGASWNVMNTDYLDAIGATDVAIDPSNSNIIYLATGDGDAGDIYSIGILKSTDGGTTWAATGLNWNVTQGRMINRLLIHPTNSNILLAATSLGVYKSINAGASWVLATSGSFKDMEFKPSDPTVVYAAGTTFFKSIDTGSTFSSITSGVPSTDVGRLSIAVSEANASIVYLLASKNSDSGFLGVYKSTNSGTSFTTTATTPNLLGWNSNGGDAGGQGWYDLALECSATDANILWVGGVNVWKSTNGGTSWACNAHWTGSGGLPYVHADVHCLSWIPANNSLYVGCDGGVFRSTNNGTSYSDVSSNLQISQQYRLGVAQLNGNKILTGWQDNGSNLKNGTAHSQVLGGDGMECIIARTNDNVMYGEIYYGAIYKSTNNGGTFNPIVNSGGTGVNADGAWVTPYAMGATDNDLYVGKSTIYKSSNAGTSFTAMGTFGTGVVNAFAVAVSNVNVIYASKGSALYKTTNASAFSAISGLPNLYITSIAVSSIDENKVWVTFSGYSAGSKVYYSSNGGTSWTNISGSLPNIPSNTIVFQNTGSDALYVGTDAGVYYKDNSLADWIPYMNGLPNVVVDELEIHAATNTITAATYGRGTWRAPLYSQPNLDLAVVSITSPNGNFCSTTVTPELTVMNAGINAITSFQLTYTISGQASQTYSWSGNLTSGNSVLVTLPVSTVSAGSYTLTINASSINGGSDDNAANNSSSSTFTIVSGAANDICSNSTNLVINAAYLTANNTVTCSDSADPICGGSGIKDVWYKFTFTGGDITIQTNSGSLVDTRIAIYSDCTDPFAIACNDDISTTNYNSRINLTCAQLTNGATYYIQAGGYAGGTGTFGIQVLATAVAGCTNVFACNYNECANTDNGSCINATTWYLDADADGYYVSSTSACTSPGATYTSTQGINGDCNDANASVNAAGVEVCGNGIDEDCSGADLACAVPGCTDNTACNYNASATVSNGSCTFASTWYLDADADGYYVSSTSACTSPGATYTSTQGINGDCNDASASVNAAGVEVCGNGIDEDCSGTDLACAVPGCMDNTACNYNASATVSNGSCTFATTWYLDADADGYYVSSTSACSSPGATYTLTQGINGDCNDASASVNAGIGESCSNNIDDNCNSLINEGCSETDVAGDIFTTPINITASFYPLCNLASGNLTGMGASPFGQINCITGEDLWYQFTAQTEGVSIQLNTTAFDGVIEIHNTNGELITSENSNASIGNEVLNFVGLTSGSVYRVGIRNYNSNLGTGNFTCCVRQLRRGACAYGPGPYQLCQIFKAQYVTGATYRFVFSGISGIANGINYTKASTSDLLVLNAVVPTLPYSSNYNVLITNIYSLSNGIGQIEIIEVPALSSCAMNTIAEPNTQLGTSFRCSNGQQFRGAIVNSQPWICGVTNWKWKFQEVDANNMAIGLPIEHLRGAASNFLNLNQIIQLQYGKKYAVQTAPVFSYGTGNYGTTQYLCIVGSAGVQSFENEYKSLEESIQQTIYPNPYDNGPLTIESNKFDKDSKVDVFIFNAQQQLIRNKQAAIVAKKITLNGLEELENGIYFLVIQSSNSKEMVKLLVIH